MLKLNHIILSAGLSLFFFTGCGDNDNPVKNSPKLDASLIGDWKMYKTVTEDTQIYLPEVSQTTLTFYGDGTYIEKGITGKWYINNNYLHRDPEGSTPDYSIKYSIEGNDLILDDELTRTFYINTGSSN